MFELYIKYLLEGIAVAIAAYFIPRKKVDISEIIFIALSAAATFAVLDIFAPKVGDGARKGAGFGIGANTVGWPSGAENFYADEKSTSTDTTNNSESTVSSAVPKGSEKKNESKPGGPGTAEKKEEPRGKKAEHFYDDSSDSSKSSKSSDSSSVTSTIASTVSSAVSSVTSSADTKSTDTKSTETKSTDTSSTESRSMDSTGSNVVGFDETKQYASF